VRAPPKDHSLRIWQICESYPRLIRSDSALEHQRLRAVEDAFASLPERYVVRVRQVALADEVLETHAPDHAYPSL
jgi:hypothetical protein